MAQQTINVGTSPNDGTGTPLRTAFQYTNSNFSELYTAVGPSGNNIVVPGTATVTGDLTCNSNVNVGASPAFFGGKIATNGHIAISAGNYLKLWNSTGTGVAGINASAADTLNFALTNAFTTAMTLNSTGLGVGTSPSYKLEVVAPAGDNIVSTFRSGDGTAANNAGGGFRSISSATAANRVAQIWLDADGANFSGGDYFFIQKNGGSGTVEFNQSSNAAMTFLTNSTERMRIDSSGNVGVGVTPSAWAAYKAVQIGRGSFSSDTSSGTTISTLFGTNFVYDGNWKYIVSAAATFFQQANGAYYWFNEAGTKTAGATFTPVQAMTLDASGNLLVGKAALSDTTVGWYVRPNGITTATMSSSVNTDTSYQLYSTGASAYRFYVGMGGTVYATNTTISAISDARLKENVQDIDVGLDAILALKPRKFDWKTGKGKNIKGDRGFIAQEFETVFPNLIDEWKDPAPEGEAPYKSVRQDLIPVLVKAIQELTARVEALEA
jgi:hypothetical protein